MRPAETKRTAATSIAFAPPPGALRRAIRLAWRAGLLALATALFLFAPAMQGIGLSVGTPGLDPADPEGHAHRLARLEAEKLAVRP